jgi:hypothetical protein
MKLGLKRGLILALSLCILHCANAQVFHLKATSLITKRNLVGRWKVVSRVIWSDCPYVEEGIESESTINISDINGSLFPSWRTAEWKLVRNKVIEFNSDETLYWERESKLNDENGKYWFVRSINQFDFSDYENVEATSHHKQYLDGEYVGEYITKSFLVKG